MNDILKKQAAEQAPLPPPSYIKEMIDIATSDEVLAPGAHRDKIMMDFAQSEAWKLVRKYIDAKLEEFAQSLRKSTSVTGDMKEIGFRFMATDLVNQFAIGLIGMVENPLKIKKAQAQLNKE